MDENGSPPTHRDAEDKLRARKMAINALLFIPPLSIGVWAGEVGGKRGAGWGAGIKSLTGAGKKGNMKNFQTPVRQVSPSQKTAAVAEGGALRN